MTRHIRELRKVPAAAVGQRFDQVAADLFPDYSRSRLQAWIREGALRLDSGGGKPNAKVAGGELMTLDVELQAEGEWRAEDIALDIVFEDEEILVLNKPAAMVVHPAAGNWEGTLLNALLHHHPDLELLPRAGIVHRLDKDTSGVMVVAKTLTTQANLVEQLQARSVSRVYWALVYGPLAGEGEVRTQMDRHPTQRTRMAVVGHGGKEAITYYRSLHNYTTLSLLELKLSTGRTHQIRVHMTHLGHPLVGDQTYRKNLPGLMRQHAEEIALAGQFPRQALHAKKLGLVHPKSGETMQWEVPLAPDIDKLLSSLDALR